MLALQNEAQAQAEVRQARVATNQAARDQRDAERKMLISAGAMREQREFLESELKRLQKQQQEEMAQALDEQKRQAKEQALAAEQMIEEVKRALEEKERAGAREDVVGGGGGEAARAAEERTSAGERVGRREGGDESARLAAEKEKRIAHTQEMAIKRIGKRFDERVGLLVGWVTRKGREIRALVAAGAKMLKPKVVAAYRQWKVIWEVEVEYEADNVI